MAVDKVTRTILTAKEAAEYLGISYWLITQLVKKKTNSLFKSWKKNFI